MSRSLIRQLEQIRRAEVYDDAVVDFNTSAVAEPVISGSLEEDMNVMRSLLKQVKGGINWFDDPGKYFDPLNTTSGSAATKQLSLANISGHTTDSKMVIIAVKSALAYPIVSGTEGVLIVPFDAAYADNNDRHGLPIFSSVSGTNYWDLGGQDPTCRVDVINTRTGAEMVTNGGDTIYGKLHDGLDHGGVGEGLGSAGDVYVKLYADGVEVDLSDIDGGLEDNDSVTFVYPYRRRMSDVLDYEWLRTDFVSGFQGDIVLIDDISNLWQYTGAGNDILTPAPWTNETASYPFASSPDNLRDAVDILNTEFGDRIYTATGIITSGDPLGDSIEDLNNSLYGALGDITNIQLDITNISGSISIIEGDISTIEGDISTIEGDISSIEGDISNIYGELLTISGTMIGDLIFTNNNFFNDGDSITNIFESLADALTTISGALDAAAPEKYVESVATLITKNTSHATPAAYTPNSTANREGMNMDVYVDGQLLAADTGADGVNADRDYAETDSTHITFRFNIQVGRNITYVIRQ